MEKNQKTETAETREVAKAMYVLFSSKNSNIPTFIFLTPPGNESPSDMITAPKTKLREASNGKYIAFYANAQRTEAWIFPKPSMHFTSDTFTAFRDMTASEYESHNVEPKRAVLKDGTWELEGEGSITPELEVVPVVDSDIQEAPVNPLLEEIKLLSDDEMLSSWEYNRLREEFETQGWNPNVNSTDFSSYSPNDLLKARKILEYFIAKYPNKRELEIYLERVEKAMEKKETNLSEIEIESYLNKLPDEDYKAYVKSYKEAGGPIGEEYRVFANNFINSLASSSQSPQEILATEAVVATPESEWVPLPEETKEKVPEPTKENMPSYLDKLPEDVKNLIASEFNEHQKKLKRWEVKKDAGMIEYNKAKIEELKFNPQKYFTELREEAEVMIKHSLDSTSYTEEKKQKNIAWWTGNKEKWQRVIDALERVSSEFNSSENWTDEDEKTLSALLETIEASKRRIAELDEMKESLPKIETLSTRDLEEEITRNLTPIVQKKGSRLREPVKVTPEGENFKLDIKIAKDVFIMGTYKLNIIATISNFGDSIRLEKHSYSGDQGAIDEARDGIDPQLKKMVPTLIEFLENKYGRKVKGLQIKNGKLEVALDAKK